MNFLLSNIELQTNKILLIFVVLSVIISSIVLLLSLIIASQNPYYEKVSAYECGFEPFEDARNKFEVRFYIVAILFIIFDLEVVYMLPWIMNIFYIGSQGFWLMAIFILILILGFIYEIIKGALDW